MCYVKRTIDLSDQLSTMMHLYGAVSNGYWCKTNEIIVSNENQHNFTFRAEIIKRII